MRISDWSSDVCSSDLKKATDGGAPRDDLTEQVFEPELVAEIEHMREGFGKRRVVFRRGRRQQRAPRLGQQRRSGAVVEDGEVPSDIRFQRQLGTQGLARGQG